VNAGLAMSDAAVCMRDVRVAAASRELLRVDELVLMAGERVAIVGPNGAGKTTLLRVIAGMTRPARGSVGVLGRVIGPEASAPLARAEWRALRREIGLVMQGLHLVPRLTARENVLIGALARLSGIQAWRSWWRWYPEALLDEADAALGTFGLSGRAHVRADRLSGGERQKVGLARLALQRPRLVLADEPTAALDPNATAQVCTSLRSSAQAAGQTLVTVVHDLDLLAALATRVIGLAHGAIRWNLPLDQVDDAALRDLYGPRSPHPAVLSACRHADGMRFDPSPRPTI
jgi:phosphonate transport system ATP-binding protein